MAQRKTCVISASPERCIQFLHRAKKPSTYWRDHRWTEPSGRAALDESKDYRAYLSSIINVNNQAIDQEYAGRKINEGGKLKRQTATTNLRLAVTKQEHEKPVIFAAQEEFEVYEDQTPTKENLNKSNNILHELEERLNQKNEKENSLKGDQRKLSEHKRFMETRHDSSEIMSVCDESSIHPPSVCGTIGFDDDEIDKISMPSATTSIRSEFSHFTMGEERFADSDLQTKFTRTLAERERKIEEMFACEEYFADIYKYMCDRQTKVRPSSRYIAKQPDVTVEMRAILIDWFNDVTNEYGLQQETLHLATSLVDRVLSKFCVEKHRLQLVGTTALMIASKYEEIYPPELKDFSHITADTFNVKQILMMEKYLLAQLDYVVSTPTIAWFASCFARKQEASKRTKHAMEYMVDLSLMDYKMLVFRPSHIAAACLCFANVLTDCAPWSRELEQTTSMNIEQFAVILPELHKLFVEARTSEYSSMFTRYSDNIFHAVSLLPPPEHVYVVPSMAMRTMRPDWFK
ncbi:unnamed protein product [Caenorhabditis bovis]|uniref:Cyclin N-terminal domain-containing protein n=1 Tax=Caenorhabditis bovis TaxID=2654633 RepID=A0A8S1EME3_9PELO|nr:unnamed protein product [Caenorhabditis bovis]